MLLSRPAVSLSPSFVLKKEIPCLTRSDPRLWTTRREVVPHVVCFSFIAPTKHANNLQFSFKRRNDPTTKFFVFQQSFFIDTTFRPGNDVSTRKLGPSSGKKARRPWRRPEFPGRNVVSIKNDCWKTKNFVVECEASENVCEKKWSDRTRQC